jgi:hypothetical protein
MNTNKADSHVLGSRCMHELRSSSVVEQPASSLKLCSVSVYGLLRSFQETGCSCCMVMRSSSTQQADVDRCTLTLGELLSASGSGCQPGMLKAAAGSCALFEHIRACSLSEHLLLNPLAEMRCVQYRTRAACIIRRLYAASGPACGMKCNTSDCGWILIWLAHVLCNRRGTSKPVVVRNVGP